MSIIDSEFKDIFLIICSFLDKKNIDNLSLVCVVLYNYTLKYKQNNFFLNCYVPNFSNITHLFNKFYNVTNISELPSSVTSIVFGYEFDQPVDKYLLPSRALSLVIILTNL